MKIVLLILGVLAIGLLVYNLTIVDHIDPLVGDSQIAVIGVVACLCALLILLILHTSKRIERRIKQRN